MILAPEPLLVHGPLLRRRVRAPARALHGEVAAVQAADAVDLHARRRVPGAARLRGRGRVHHRERDPRARRRDRHVLRGRPLAHRRRCPSSRSAASAGSRWSPARRSCRSRSTAPRACATGSAPQFPKVQRALRGRDPLAPGRRTRRASSSRPWRTRSSRASRSSTQTLDAERSAASARRRRGGLVHDLPPGEPQHRVAEQLQLGIAPRDRVDRDRVPVESARRRSPRSRRCSAPEEVDAVAADAAR